MEWNQSGRNWLAKHRTEEERTDVAYILLRGDPAKIKRRIDGMESIWEKLVSEA
jgi:hypothetical protein